MKRSIVIFLLGFSICSFTFSGFAQDDETRQATGLPMKIGENSNKDRAPLSGKITLQGSEASAIKHSKGGAGSASWARKVSGVHPRAPYHGGMPGQPSMTILTPLLSA